jgi:outer membrane protein assembly factor BamA
MTKFRYNPLYTLRPFAYTFEYAPGNFGTNALTISAAGGDIVGNHSFGAAIVADPNAPAPTVSVNYSYGRLPFDLGVGFSTRFVPRNDYRLSGAAVDYLEESYNFRSSIGYNDPGEFNSHSVSMTYTATLLDSALPVAGQTLDPYASTTLQPLRGLLSTVSLAYSFNNVEQSFYALGPVRGTTFRVSLDVADDFLGSEESLYSARYNLATYIQLPWGYQTLALRSGGGMSAGSFARRGTFFVGGYNLENTPLLDQVTNGVLDGAFVLRGYEPGSFRGRTFILNSAEYRVPIIDLDLGIETVPVYLRNVAANFYIDYGGAFDDFNFDELELFSKGSLIYSPQLQTGLGAELWLSATLGYGLTTLFRVGYALGTSVTAVPGGMPYLIAAGSF